MGFFGWFFCGLLLGAALGFLFCAIVLADRTPDDLENAFILDEDGQIMHLDNAPGCHLRRVQGGWRMERAQ
jgi:hypothetical protein